MVHRPFVAPVAEPKRVPEKLQQIETELAQCKNTVEDQDRRFQELSKKVLDLGNTAGMLKKTVRLLLVKLGAEVPDELIDADQFVVTSAVVAPKTETEPS